MVTYFYNESGVFFMLKSLKRFGWGYILLFLLLLAVGICLISFHQALSDVALAIGIILLVFGIVFAVLTMADKRRGIRFALRMILALSAIIGGAVTLTFRTEAAGTLVSFLALFLIVDGSFKLQTTALSKRYGLALWWFVLVPAVLVILGGFSALRVDISTDEALRGVSLLLGITTVVDGIANLLSAFFVLRCEQLSEKETVDEYLREQEAAAERIRRRAEKIAAKAAIKEEKAAARAAKRGKKVASDIPTEETDINGTDGQ